MIYIIPIVIMIVAILPDRETFVRLGKKASTEAFMICFFIQAISLIVYIMLLSNETYLEIFCYIHSVLSFMVLILKIVIVNQLYKKKLANRILNLGYIGNLTNGQIRNLLIEKYDDVYTIKDIENIMKKLYK